MDTNQAIEALTIDLHSIRQQLIHIESTINSINVTTSAIAEKIRDNGDTTLEDVDRYLTKIARMLLDSSWGSAERFLRDVYDHCKATNHISRRQMTAVDRIESTGRREARGAQAQRSTYDPSCIADPFNDSWEWGD